ncbi:MAG: lysophospholipid acyltransferase family protein [Kiritimatiellae bacterium]|nr:lysophospholipid acyltransferase family protein [Kiritimatiellia bacterium]
MAVRLRYRVEYALLRGSAAFFNALPYPVALAVGACFARLISLVARSRVREARRRIAEVFPDKSARAVRRIARISLRNVVFSVVESLRFPRMTREWVERHLDVGNFPEMVEAHLTEGQGAVFAIPHMGNWEMSGLAAGQRGHPMFMLVGRQRNPLADDFMNRTRAATGVTVVSRDKNVARNILHYLRQGKTFGILPDVRMPGDGVQVRFLGRDVELPGGIALFARRANVPICIGYVRRIGWTRHQWHFIPPVWSDPTLDKREDEKRILQLAADVYTEAIREHPEQYFWYNKRWVLEPRKK